MEAQLSRLRAFGLASITHLIRRIEIERTGRRLSSFLCFTGLLNQRLQNPSIPWCDLFVVVFRDAKLGKTVSLVELFCTLVGDLDVQVNTSYFCLLIRRSGILDELKALGSNAKGAIRLGEVLDEV